MKVFIFFEKLISKIGKPFIGLNPSFEPKFFSMFETFITQYSGVSFGQPTFSQYVILFLKMYWPSKYRHYIFQELGIQTLKHLHPILPDESQNIQYYVPYETNLDVLNEFMILLKMENILEYKESNPFIFKYIIHDISSNVFPQNEMTFYQRNLLEEVILTLKKVKIFYD